MYNVTRLLSKSDTKNKGNESKEIKHLEDYRKKQFNDLLLDSNVVSKVKKSIGKRI